MRAGGGGAAALRPGGIFTRFLGSGKGRARCLREIFEGVKASLT